MTADPDQTAQARDTARPAEAALTSEAALTAAARALDEADPLRHHRCRWSAASDAGRDTPAR